MGAENRGLFCPWKYTIHGWKRPWIVLNFFFPSVWKRLPVDVLCQPNYSVILWIQARSAGKLLSIPILLFSPSLTLVGLFCFIQDSLLSTSILSDMMNAWHQTQGAAAALVFLWKPKEFLSSLTGLNWFHQNNENQYYKYMLIFFPLLLL